MAGWHARGHHTHTHTCSHILGSDTNTHACTHTLTCEKSLAHSVMIILAYIVFGTTLRPTNEKPMAHRPDANPRPWSFFCYAIRRSARTHARARAFGTPRSNPF